MTAPFIGSALLRFVSDFEYDLTPRVTRRDLLLRFHCFGKRERLRNDYLDFTLVDQFANLGQLIRICLYI
jgi:hypothetical protein